MSLLARLRPHTVRLLQKAPWPLNEHLLAACSPVYWFLHPHSFRRSLEWAACQPSRRGPAWRLALALAGHCARYYPYGALLFTGEVPAVRRRLVVEGGERLEQAAARGATIALVFHLGPQVAASVLERCGYPKPMFIGTREGALQWAGGLYQMRRLLMNGETVGISADGLGREAFRIPLPGAPMIVRAGWWVLRRSTGATTLPVLERRERSRVVVTVHPPLPAPDPDPGRDLEACRQALTPILMDYQRRFPAQCFSLAFSFFGSERPSTRRSVAAAWRRIGSRVLRGELRRAFVGRARVSS